ncbi:MAG: 50S ribosome-binding GTPase [Bifidobacteriaceae bacterium]|jgi:GTP-binding protein EngB required for normal cell division|nr:50S ribosome-binding GTPase [Bifidobacteriaceae bacterium]
MAETAATALADGIGRVEEAAQLASTHLGANTAAPLLELCGRLRERLARGVDHTIVALEGGTGSGKSSLFNAIAEMAFSEVGVLRPTTEKATACVWGEGAGALLDWLGIERDSWIQRDSVLESHVDELRGMILVDLPDYDSAVQAHRETAEKVLPLADVLVWVTDPQKYADPALHERFVALARAHEGRTHMVVLNQVDTVDEDDAAAIAEAMAGLLVEDGLTDPVVVLTSATRGDGVAGLREALVAQTVHHTTALLRTAADLGAAARGLADLAAGGAERDEAQAEAGAWLSPAGETMASGLTAAVIKAATDPDGQGTLAAPVAPAAERLAELKADWAKAAEAHLPATWAAALSRAAAGESALGEALGEALSQVVVPPRPGFWRRLFLPARSAESYQRAYERRVAGAIGPVVESRLTEPALAALGDRARVAQAADDVSSLARRVATDGAA